jgi:large subunit ribosomal protein L44e
LLEQVTKKITLKMKCEKCSTIKMKNLGRCKHFELGAEKKKKGPMVCPCSL